MHDTMLRIYKYVWRCVRHISFLVQKDNGKHENQSFNLCACVLWFLYFYSLLVVWTWLINLFFFMLKKKPNFDFDISTKKTTHYLFSIFIHRIFLKRPFTKRRLGWPSLELIIEFWTNSFYTRKTHIFRTFRNIS